MRPCCCILLSFGLFTVSKALLISSDTRMVLDDCCVYLKRSTMVFVILCWAVVVECLLLNPCW